MRAGELRGGRDRVGPDLGQELVETLELRLAAGLLPLMACDLLLDRSQPISPFPRYLDLQLPFSLAKAA